MIEDVFLPGIETVIEDVVRVSIDTVIRDGHLQKQILLLLIIQFAKLPYLDDNAWWNRKKRLDNDVRSVFRGLGYQVPAYEEIELEQERYIKRSGRNPKKIREKLEKQKKGA